MFLRIRVGISFLCNPFKSEIVAAACGSLPEMLIFVPLDAHIRTVGIAKFNDKLLKATYPENSNELGTT